MKFSTSVIATLIAVSAASAADPQVTSSGGIATCGLTQFAPCLGEEGKVIEHLGKVEVLHEDRLDKRSSYWWDLIGNSLNCGAQATAMWQQATGSCRTQDEDGHWYTNGPCITSIVTSVLMTGATIAALADGWRTIHGRDLNVNPNILVVPTGNDVNIQLLNMTSALTPRSIDDIPTYVGSGNITISGVNHGSLTVNAYENMTSVLFKSANASWITSEPNTRRKRMVDENNSYFNSNVGIKFNWCHTSSRHRLNERYDWSNLWSVVDNDMQYINRCWGYDLGLVDTNDRVNGWPILISTGYLILESQGFGDGFETCHRSAFNRVAHDDNGNDEL